MKTAIFVLVLSTTFFSYADGYSEMPERETLFLEGVYLFDGRAVPMDEVDDVYLYGDEIDYLEVDGEIIDRTDIEGFWFSDEAEGIEVRMPAGAGGYLRKSLPPSYPGSAGGSGSGVHKKSPPPSYPAGSGGGSKKNPLPSYPAGAGGSPDKGQMTEKNAPMPLYPAGAGGLLYVNS